MVIINKMFILAVILFIAMAMSVSSDAVSAATKTSSTTKVSVDQLNGAASAMDKYYKKNKKLPQNVYINKNKMTMYQYYYLVVTRTSQLASGNKKAITIKKTVKAPSTTSDTLKNGKINKKEYVNMAKNVKKFTDKNNRLPNYVTSTRGKLKFESAVVNYNRILVFYKNNKRLPTYVTATRYTGKAYKAEGTNTPTTTPTTPVNPSARPVYIVSDNIYNTATDNAMINNIITELSKYGVKAYNGGIGSNKHWNIVKNSSVPLNALVVEIFGGACAATIKDIGSTSYKYYQSTRKVYVVFYDTAKKITGLSFLERAYDDNFSDKDFKGLATPDIYLLSNGVNYYEGYTTSKLPTLAQILYKEAIS